MRPKLARGVIHGILLTTLALTLVPFFFMVNSALRESSEFYHGTFAAPRALRQLGRLGLDAVEGRRGPVVVTDEFDNPRTVPRAEAARYYASRLTVGAELAWDLLRRYILNSFLVSGLTALGVCFLGSGTAYLLARYRFIGRKFVFTFILATMIFPGVLTLVPSFLLVKQLGLLNTYGSMILPYIAGGQVFAIFVFKSFFEGLSEELFESARLDGAGHWSLYWHIILPLSRPVFSVVTIMNVLGTWNNFLWPYIVNTDDRHHVVASGLYTMASSTMSSNPSTLYAAWTISSIPLLVLFVYATKPFIRGLTSGALRA
ncbi:MAG: carbohydrate ABC transporter permease [Verrucomicrobia bacterium]|nr:carbohydrate ABC transporter permease [Verrucomicrobiota bacterium]